MREPSADEVEDLVEQLLAVVRCFARAAIVGRHQGWLVHLPVLRYCGRSDAYLETPPPPATWRDEAT